MSYSKTLTSGKDIAIVRVTGWGEPGLAISQRKLKDILAQLDVIGSDMVSSKEGIAGEALHFLEQELGSLLRTCEEIE